ncbi:MAG: TonB-dependent receptor [Sphingomonadales bacterium]
MKHARSKLMQHVAIAALSMIPVAAFAAPAADAADDTIVVTAQRRSEDAMAVPVAVSVLKSDQLRDYQAAGSDTLLSLSGKVPSLYVESTTGRIFPRFYIRGLGNIDFYLGASQPVSIIQDDVVMEHVVLKSNPAFDIAQVEVLKGPQGSLFGRNTTAGIIKFDSAQPTETFAGQFSASYGRFNSVNVDAGVGGPLNSDGTIAFRISGLYQHRDNFIANTYTGPSADGTVGGNDVLGGYDERDVRAQLLFKPTDALSVRLSGHYRDYEGTATPFYRGSILPGVRQSSPTLNRFAVANDEGMNNPQAYKTHGASLKLDYDLGGVTLTSISAWEHASGYSRGDTDGGAAANFGGVGFGQSQGKLRGLDQLSQEIRIASPDTGPFKWQVGGIYFDSRDDTEFDQRTFFLTTGGNPNNFVVLHNVNTSWALFGQASYQLTQQLTLSGGVRVTNDVKKTDLVQHPNSATLSIPATAPASSFACGTAFSCRLSDTQPSWDASLLYRASDDVSVFARVARGFRGPTIQGRSAVFGSAYTTANSETNTSYEAGLKTAMAGNTVHFNLTGFYYNVDNIQLNGNDSNGNGVLLNAKKAVGYGLEAEFDARPTPNLRFNAGFSWLNTEIKDPNVFAQVGSAVIGGVPTPSQTVLNPLTPVGNNFVAAINGNSLPNAPEFNLNIGARYDQPVGSGDGKLFIATDFNMQGRTHYVLYKTVEYNSVGNFELGLKAGYSFGRYEVAAFVRNLTDETNLIGVIDTSNYRAGIYNEPRVFGLTVSGSFR